jgi:hypothetical protein
VRVQLPTLIIVIAAVAVLLGVPRGRGGSGLTSASRRDCCRQSERFGRSPMRLGCRVMKKYLWAGIVPTIACIATLYNISRSPSASAMRAVDFAQVFFAGLCVDLAIWGTIVVSRASPTR